MLKLFLSLILMYSGLQGALSAEALFQLKRDAQSKQQMQSTLPSASLDSRQLRSAQSELQKLLGKWKVTTDFYGNPSVNYFNFTENFRCMLIMFLN